MWKFRNFLFATLLIAGGLSTAKAYNVNCTYNLGYPACGTFFITSITSANETANIIGQPSTYVDNVTQVMDFYENKPISFIPTDLFNKLTGITYFQAGPAGLSTITTNAFVNCKFLKEIRLSQNPFKTLPASFAEQCILVNSIYMSFNELTTIDEKAFKGMFNLEHLNLSNNKITCIPPLLFQDNKKISQLDLSANYITALHPVLFQGMTVLSLISFINNPISYIPNMNFDQVILFSLMLYDNPIMAIDPIFLTQLYKNFDIRFDRHVSFAFQRIAVSSCVSANFLNQTTIQTDPRYINYENWSQRNIFYTNSTPCYSNWTPQMADNSLVTCGTKIPTTTTRSTSTSSSTSTTTAPSSVITAAPCPGNRECRYFLDQHNRYSCVIDGVDGALNSISGTHMAGFTDTNVERVFFTKSFIRKVPAILFQKFPNLTFLYMRNCSMGIIDNHTFSQCGNLQFLDVSYNDIIHVTDTSLRNCTKLTSIDMTGNPVDYISTQMYVLEPNLKIVHLNRLEGLTLA